MTINDLTPQERKLLFWLRLYDAIVDHESEQRKEKLQENYQRTLETRTPGKSSFAVSHKTRADDA